MIEPDTLEDQAEPIYLGIGSNLGNKKENIENAKFKLLLNNIKILQVSNLYESLSWPNKDNPKFFNIVVKISTNMTPINLLHKCKEIEIELGRKQSHRNSPRRCDIDILDYKSKQMKNDVILPHPRMHKRNFVLLPLFELNQNWKHPVLKVHIKKLIFLLSNNDISSIKKI